MNYYHLNPLIEALRELVGDEPLIEPLASVLADACIHASIPYDSIINRAESDAQELILAAWDWKLLIPRRCAACGEWDHRLLVTSPGEIYEMPNIIRYLVQKAGAGGAWDVQTAVADLYHDMGEPQWEKMPELVFRLGRQAERFVVSAGEINAACRNSGFYYRTGSLILILKGGGIISPKLAAGPAAAKRHSPLYELNPSLYPHRREDAATT
ncbi:MAG: hypothetical protein KGY38_01105 [Desulfobacterales bacterium]|nr:hypothetical protein [Desulfobacterales bacterium]